MLKSITQRLSFIAAIFAASSIVASAQSYELPGEHAEHQRELIAGQIEIGNQIRIDQTQQYIGNLIEEEEEPELDIYLEGWESRRVNPFNEADVPFSAVINVADFCMPHPGYLTSNYGYRKKFKREHKGVDIKVYVGDTIRAAFDGRVRLTNFERKGYGNYVILRHTNGLETVYGHLSGFLIEENDYVKAGDPIALGGNTGKSTGPHLHFETRYMGYPINPCAIFDFANQTVHTDEYTFTKDTYKQARNFDPAANSEYAKTYLASNPKPKNTSAVKAGSSSKPATYKVRKGDTLSKIAARNHVTVKQLCKLNNLKTSSTLKVGQRLRLR